MSADRWAGIAVRELVRQSGPMLFLDAVLEHAPDVTRCSVEVDASRLFRDAGGSVPAWLGLEYMAQCAAAHGGLAARARGEAPGQGLFLGSRRVAFHTDAFEPGQRLVVTARHHRGESGLVAFDCEVRDRDGGGPLVEGRLSVYTLSEEGAGGTR